VGLQGQEAEVRGRKSEVRKILVLFRGSVLPRKNEIHQKNTKPLPTSAFRLGSEALPKQVRHLDKERPAVATEARHELRREGMEALVSHVVVIPDVKRRTWTRCPARQELRAYPPVKRVVVNNGAGECRLSELIGTPPGQYVYIKGDESRVVAAQSLLVQAYRRS
jgi:hypothetical protein